jgi:predicted secreted protein
VNEQPTREGPHTEIHSSPGTVEVELPETPGTGYVWEPVPLPASVREVGRTFEEAAARPTAGGSGTRRFRLEVGRQGRHELEFLLRRPWEAAPIERRTVTLVVGADESS